ncbi:hypothetical protein TEA_023269 [Camellia sinensis var. sinensis]|uniref:Uncharacterized protein n=1 Tax=Camellia sinensis var. sinensis TaxID=542762 RepID=A0A4S4EIK8_CAMSN|nr:hypothetical protein TEA_023269 [Camellia sinensis var. sinensis]
MAFCPSKLILSLLFVIATTASVAHSIPVVDQQLLLSVAGRVVCTLLGTNCTTCPGIAGVNVILSCNGGQTTLAQAITTRGGSVNLTLSAPFVPLFHPSQQCFVYVKLPIATCKYGSRGASTSRALPRAVAWQAVVAEVSLFASIEGGVDKGRVVLNEAEATLKMGEVLRVQFNGKRAKVLQKIVDLELTDKE